MREFAKEFYQSQAWKECRSAFMKSRRGLCERCLAKGLIVPAAIVHHKIHITPENITRPEIVLSWDNLEAVCRQCHADLHGAKSGRRFTVDELGRVIPLVENVS